MDKAKKSRYPARYSKYMDSKSSTFTFRFANPIDKPPQEQLDFFNCSPASDAERLRKIIGIRTRLRRLQLNLGQEYLAEKLDVNKSTIHRYEAGTIDNSKKLIVNGLANALRVSPEWLRGETDDMETKVNSNDSVEIDDYLGLMNDILPLNASEEWNTFYEKTLLLALKELYVLKNNIEEMSSAEPRTNQSLDEGPHAGAPKHRPKAKKYVPSNTVEKTLHTANLFARLSAALQLFMLDPEKAIAKLDNLLSEYKA